MVRMKPSTVVNALRKFVIILLIGLLCFSFSGARSALAAEIPLIVSDGAVQWSLFNLVVAILNALIAFALFARHAFLVRCGNRFKRDIALLNRVFTDICVLLAMIGIIVFFIVEEWDTSMAVFDFLSPLFGALFVLTVLAAILAILRPSEETGSGHRDG